MLDTFSRTTRATPCFNANKCFQGKTCSHFAMRIKFVEIDGIRQCKRTHDWWLALGFYQAFSMFFFRGSLFVVKAARGKVSENLLRCLRAYGSGHDPDKASNLPRQTRLALRILKAAFPSHRRLITTPTIILRQTRPGTWHSIFLGRHILRRNPAHICLSA